MVGVVEIAREWHGQSSKHVRVDLIERVRRVTKRCFHCVLITAVLTLTRNRPDTLDIRYRPQPAPACGWP